MGFLYFNLANTEEHLLKSEFNYLEAAVVEDLNKFFDPISADFDYVSQMLRVQRLDMDDDREFLSRFIPILYHSNAISSIMLVNEKGEEFMLLKSKGNFSFRHTITSGDSLISKRYRIYFDEENRIQSEFIGRLSNYDPKERPWYQSAQDAEMGETKWSDAPYRFFTTKEMGITLSGKVKDRRDQIICLAFDIRLKELSKLSEEVKLGENGAVLITSIDTLIVGLPVARRIDSIQRDSLLLTHLKDFPHEGMQLIYSASLKNHFNQGPVNQLYKSESWWIDWNDFKVGNLVLPIVMLGNEKDFQGNLSQSRTILLASIFIIGLFFFFMMRSYAKERKSNSLLLASNETIAEQKQLIESHLEELNDSINYSERVQYALLSDSTQLPGLFPESFLLFQPKDVVSGDFYWFVEKEGLKFIAAVDCTGHGIPGALLSVMGTNFLQHIVLEEGILEPSAILNELRTMVANAFNTVEGDKRHDGMDMALLVFDEAKQTVRYSGAKNPLYFIRDNELEVYDADRMAVGFEVGKAFSTSFNQVEIQLKKHDVMYVFSDGYADQFGGPKGKKFMYGKLKKLLVEIHQEKMDTQKKILLKTFEDWKGSEPQIDDVIIIGIRV